MVKNKLSIIIPFAQENPQVAFTIQAIYCELRDRCDFEIIAIDNHCTELDQQIKLQNKERDDGGKYLSSLANADRPWLKYIAYDEKLSHWNAKNAGVALSDGEFLWFVDAHCIPSQGTLLRMFNHYSAFWQNINGTLHLPLSYMLEKPGLELQYKLVTEPQKGVWAYTFSRYTGNPGDNEHNDRYAGWHYRVPCMSTCGMMMHRSIFYKLGGWPHELGIYGGGEHFINFCLAVMGMTVNIYPALPLYHYAAPRGYHWNYGDYHRNRTIATYCFAGREMAELYGMNIKGEERDKRNLLNTSIYNQSVMAHARLIETQKVMSIEEWTSQWQEVTK